ncbi:hypothetical protein DMENIID0001_078010 [Sergentomyia squamirostris]
MEQWKNRTAVVTGASSGIGAAVAQDLVKAGMIVIGLARRFERVEALKKDLPANLQENLHAVKCDVSKEENIVNVFSWIDSKFNGIDVLINNAGIHKAIDLIHEENSLQTREMVDTNLLSYVFCTREAYKSMAKHGRNSHVVHMNSVLGHNILFNPDFPPTNMYIPTKFAITALTEIHRQEFIRSKHHVKVSSISPGFTRTEIVPSAFLEVIPLLEPSDVSQSILYILGTPPHVQIHDLMIRPFGETVV